MARVTVEDCVVKVPNRFELVLLAAQRAREITSGAPLSLDRDDDKNPVVALREIADETVGLDHLKDSLVRGMQKHVEMDEPEEAPDLEQSLFGAGEPIGAVISEDEIDEEADEDALNRAYVYSLKAHGTQLRASGDPYFSHPVEVAGLLAQMKLDTASIVTGLLHDTVEDTVATLDDIEKLFGPDIGRLVDGVTKLSRIELQSDHTQQAENFRKLVLAMSEDIRVLLVKLADRLHNMQTLRFIKDPEKRRR